MRASIVGFRLSLVAALGLVLGPSVRAEETPPVTILSPKGKDNVERFFELTGKVLTRGWPVVLIRVDQPDSPWWVQAPVQATTPGSFSAPVRFGNDETPSGREFRVVVLMARTAEEAAQWKPGESVKDLDSGIPRSEEVGVVLIQPEQRAELGDVIQSPKADARVRREDRVRGVIKKEGVPLVLIRSAQADNPWWVQETKRQENGEFTADARFGNETTLGGSLFRVVVVLATEKQAASLPVGHTLKSIPKDLLTSKEIHVVFDRPAEPGPAATAAKK